MHLLALGIGMESVWARPGMRRPLDADGLKRVFTHDNWYGIAALLWYPTGIARAFFGFEGTGYYLHQPFFSWPSWRWSSSWARWRCGSWSSSSAEVLN